ncbi:RNA-binding protein [Thermosynechococcus sp. NK55a]|uniref:RNA recognition motif domain-containing protein n=1 Tax=Thermosynechococcus sp. NK55a TaxID=1394889 RepID=UPI002100C5A5|nr:RNA-binding protein [Thermosynechococcus sp. NK55a]
MSVRLYVGNLPRDLSREELEALFSQEVGEVATTKLITDRKTGKCRGFGFVTVESEEVADQVIEKLNGYTFKDNPLKIEKANDKPKSEAKEKEEAAAEKTLPATAAITAKITKTMGGVLKSILRRLNIAPWIRKLRNPIPAGQMP